MLTHDRLKEVLTYNQSTGHLIWLQTNSNRAVAGKRAGTVDPRGYRGIRIDGVRYYEHRLIPFLLTGSWPENLIDHKNMRRGHNRASNLRDADHSQNKSNRRKPANNTSGVKGVYWHKRARKWCAQIQVRGENHYLGLHTTKKSARQAYTSASNYHFKEFSRP